MFMCSLYIGLVLLESREKGAANKRSERRKNEQKKRSSVWWWFVGRGSDEMR
jgi:hypothetical protein